MIKVFRYFVINKKFRPWLNRKLIAVFFAALFVTFASAVLSAAEKYPRPRGAVNDFANVIDQSNKAKMEALAREVLQKTGAAVVVATVPSIGENEDISLYVNKLYKEWGIGKKGEDKGVLIFLALKERKIRIETGYGAEGVLPDGLVGEILDTHVVPQLKAGNYGLALFNAMSATSSYIAKDAGVVLSNDELPPKADAKTKEGGLNALHLLIFLAAAAIFAGTKTGRSMLPWILVMLLSGGGCGRGGGGFSGGFGGFGGFGGGLSGGGGAGRSF